MMRDQTEFESVIDRWVSAQLASPMMWNSLLYSLPGVYPELILKSAKRLSLLHRIHFTAGELSKRPAPSLATDLWAKEKLATPHPLDSTWWFGDSALKTLLERIESLSTPRSNVLLLGTPTLFHYAKGQSKERSFFLVDHESAQRKNGIHGHISVDLLSEQPSLEKSNVIVADPPWYPQETRAFLLTAVQNATRSGKILLSVPPVGTRPGIEEEWQDLLMWARDMGLRLLAYETGILPYLSPLFEKNALRAGGVEVYPEDWRRGDLATFEWDGTSERPRSSISAARKEEWSEILFGRVQLRVRTSRCTVWKTPVLKEIVPGGVLPTVSRRDERLASVGAWTSGNRVFECGGTHVLGIIALAVATQQCVVRSVASLMGVNLTIRQKVEIEEVATVLADVAAIERQEITDWGNRRNDNVVELPSYQS
jgi:hypothetical protein